MTNYFETKFSLTYIYCNTDTPLICKALKIESFYHTTQLHVKYVHENSVYPNVGKILITYNDYSLLVSSYLMMYKIL